MIASIVVGSGNSRVSVPMVRDRDQRRSAANAIKAHLFPTQGAFHRALRVGKRRAAQYRSQLGAAA